MRFFRFPVLGMTLLLLTACNAVSSKYNNAHQLVLKLETKQREVHSLEDLSLQVTLLNQSASSVLVHKRLFWLPYPDIPWGMSEMVILISDSSGNLIKDMGFFVKYQFPGEDTLDVLKPGEQIMKTVHPGSLLHEFTFTVGEKYTVVAVYRNELDIAKTIDRVEVPAWVGTIRSNEETFVILPPED
jgi:hypothetical protein